MITGTNNQKSDDQKLQQITEQDSHFIFIPEFQPFCMK